MSTPEDLEGIDEVRAIRALAHPLRLKLLDLLRFEGPSTATLLGRRLGESSGATSYHLRILARYGYVEDAPQTGHHERWWRHRDRPVILPQAPSDDMSERHLLADILSREAHALDRYLATRAHPSAWDDSAFFRSVALRLTVAEFDQLRQGFAHLIEGLHRADDADAPADSAPIRVLVFGFPQVLEES